MPTLTQYSTPTVAQLETPPSGPPRPPFFSVPALACLNSHSSANAEHHSDDGADIETFLKRDSKMRRGLDPDFDYPAHRFATAAALRKNIPHFIQTVGLPHVGHLLLTFRTRVSVKDARRALNNAWRRFFPLLFGHNITVVEFTKSGRVHFHILAQCHHDISSGFDHAAYVQYKLANESANAGGTPLTCRQRRAMRDAIPANDALRKVWRALDEGLRDFGFGAVYDLFPIQTNEIGISHYLAKQFIVGLAFVQEKGARLVSYSKGCPRAVPPGWRPPSRWFQERLNALLRVFGLQERQHLRDRLGPRWAYGILQLMDCLQRRSADWPNLSLLKLAPLVSGVIIRNKSVRHYLDVLLLDVASTINASEMLPGPPPPPPPPPSPLAAVAS